MFGLCLFKKSDNMLKRYNDLNSYLRSIFGCRVQKITVDAGMTCPNRDGTLGTGGCIYCNARGSGTGAHAAGLSIAEQLIQGKAVLSKRYKAKRFIAYFQSFSNTYAPIDRLKRLYDEALSIEDVVGLSIGTRPDCVNEPVLALLAEYAKNYMVWIEYGLQSAHDHTLARINRGHDVDRFKQAVAATRNRGIRTCTHIILGLPGEDRHHMMETVKTVADMGLDGIKIHLLYVVRGTPLEQMYLEGTYQCLSQKAYVDLVCDTLERLPEEMVVQRLTGDPHPEELVAPQWSLRKGETLNLIKSCLEERDTWQGKYYTAVRSSPR
jgi:uncharacterized protein